MVTQQGMPQENTSGMGDASVIPPGVKGWSWGAFLLNWIWGIGNSVFIALLCFIPLVNIVMMFVLGFKGREWAWRKKRWNSVEEFNKVQRYWSLAVLPVLAVIVILAVGLPYFIGGMFDAHKTQALNLLRQAPQAREVLGDPIEPGWLTSGKTSISNGRACALLWIPVSGPKGSGSVKFAAVGQGSNWIILEETLTTDNGRIEIVSHPDKDRYADEMQDCRN